MSVCGGGKPDLGGVKSKKITKKNKWLTHSIGTGTSTLGRGWIIILTVHKLGKSRV
jgi:hypothetical protein